jgi:predicted metal-dependent hydrolase
MADSHTIHVKDIGNVLFQTSARARRIIISVRPGKGIRVAVPRRTSIDSAMAFVRAKKPWLQKHVARIQAYEKQKQAARDMFLNLDQSEAKKKITGRLRELARQYHFSYGKVSLRNQRTRWGSCSVKGNISLNMKLVALPRDLFDYVILHELVHTRVHNHSRKFWQELDKYVGSGKAKAKQLIEYGLQLL